MRVKKTALVVTFDQTTDAMAAERLFGELGLRGRLIPIPPRLSAGCGLAWKAPPEEQARLEQALAEAEIPWRAMEALELWA